MANKRTLKKHIQRVCGEAAVLVLTELPAEVAHKIVIKLATLQSSALAKVSFSYDRTHKDFGNAQEYNKARRSYSHAAYCKLLKEFNDNLQTIVSEINSTLTAQQREANKSKAKG